MLHALNIQGRELFSSGNPFSSVSEEKGISTSLFGLLCSGPFALFCPFITLAPVSYWGILLIFFSPPNPVHPHNHFPSAIQLHKTSSMPNLASLCPLLCPSPPLVLAFQQDCSAHFHICLNLQTWTCYSRLRHSCTKYRGQTGSVWIMNMCLHQNPRDFI